MCGGDVEQPSNDYKTPACLKPTPVEKAKPGDLVVEKFPVTYDGYTYLHSHIAYVKGRPPAPVILVHHNFCGLKQFDIDQASFLAKVGYVGLAVDLYKETENYKYADRATFNWLEAAPLMNGLYMNPKAWRGLMKAHLDAAFEHPAVEKGLAGAIGYCLGGQCCLEQMRGGQTLQACVTFHGLLQSRPFRPGSLDPMNKMNPDEYKEAVDIPPSTFTPGCRLVVENGQYDGEVSLESIGEFMTEMHEHDVEWQFHTHSKAPHGFALAPGTVGSSYVEDVDRRSTMSMLAAFAEAWPAYRQHPVETNASGTKLNYCLTRMSGAKGKGKSKGGSDTAAGKGSGKGKKGGGKGQGGGKGKPVWRVKATSP
mmetsp:Transcript_69646/g.175430  ORF Transcript_69646/g.175430 Transcript_69646/m.175430 type:complete len:367 (-) Transcript_69646:22-1122(-)